MQRLNMHYYNMRLDEVHLCIDPLSTDVLNVSGLFLVKLFICVCLYLFIFNSKKSCPPLLSSFRPPSIPYGASCQAGLDGILHIKAHLVFLCLSTNQGCASNPLCLTTSQFTAQTTHTCPSSTLQIAALENPGRVSQPTMMMNPGDIHVQPLLQITFNDPFERHVKMQAILDASHQHIHVCQRGSQLALMVVRFFLLFLSSCLRCV